jgi:putative transcriptional regulator
VDKKLFSSLVESMTQMNEIARGERAPSREFVVDALGIQEIRKSTGLSQAQFAAVIDVQVSTLRNWEQGRRAPTGPARALFKALKNDPKNVLRALSGSS